MVQIIFHGIGGDHLAVSKEAHEQLIKYLAENQDKYWTDTYINIMRYLNRIPAAPVASPPFEQPTPGDLK